MTDIQLFGRLRQIAVCKLSARGRPAIERALGEVLQLARRKCDRCGKDMPLLAPGGKISWMRRCRACHVEVWIRALPAEERRKMERKKKTRWRATKKAKSE